MSKVKLGKCHHLHLELQSMDSTLEPVVLMFGTASIPLVLQIPIHRGTLSVQANNMRKMESQKTIVSVHFGSKAFTRIY